MLMLGCRHDLRTPIGTITKIESADSIPGANLSAESGQELWQIHITMPRPSDESLISLAKQSSLIDDANEHHQLETILWTIKSDNLDITGCTLVFSLAETRKPASLVIGGSSFALPKQ